MYYPSSPKDRNPKAVFTRADRFNTEAANSAAPSPGPKYLPPNVNTFMHSVVGNCNKVGTFSQFVPRHHIADNSHSSKSSGQSAGIQTVSTQPFISETHMRENMGLVVSILLDLSK